MARSPTFWDKLHRPAFLAHIVCTWALAAQHRLHVADHSSDHVALARQTISELDDVIRNVELH
jgi:hypothetical protein